MSREDKRRQPHPRTNNRFKIGGHYAYDGISSNIKRLRWYAILRCYDFPTRIRAP
jgi:hypothetical protein